MSTTNRTARVTPRMGQGGAEQGILQLLETIDDTHLIVTGPAGHCEARAKELAARYTCMPEPDSEALVDALSKVERVHLHTLNANPLAPLAAQLAGPDLIVETIENESDPDTCLFTDFSILIGEHLRDLLATPSRTEWVSNGVHCPPNAPELRRLPAPGARLRLVEVRRPDKQMRFTLEEVLATGVLDDLDIEAFVVGPGGVSDDPRVSRFGTVSDPTPWLDVADVLLCGSASDSFGRVPYEALAHGAIPIVSSLACYQRGLAESGFAFLTEAMTAAEAARDVRRALDQLAMHGDLPERRAHAYAWVHEDFSVEAMTANTERIYTREAACVRRERRSFFPEDIQDPSRAHFFKLLDALVAGRPPHPSALEELGQRPRGVLAWALARYGQLPASERLALLRASREALGERAIVEYHCGIVERDAGLFADGAASLSRAVKLEPDNVQARLALTECLAQTGDLRSAERAIRDLLRDIPEYAGGAGLLDLAAELQAACS